MGAITFSIDSRLLKMLKNTLPLEVFVETGTFCGDGIELAKPYFQTIYSVELSQEYFDEVQDRYRNVSGVTLIHGDSGLVLQSLAPTLKDRSVVYWLDAHWCAATNTAGELSQCPLLAEISAIQSLNENSVLLIDDARLFQATPLAPHEVSQWPDLDDVLQQLYKLSHHHAVMILNDCIMFYPRRIKNEVRQYASLYGTDWLNVLDKGRDYDALLKQLKEKERLIMSLDQVCREQEGEIIHLRGLTTEPKFNSSQLQRVIQQFQSQLINCQKVLQKEISILETQLTHSIKQQMNLFMSMMAEERMLMRKYFVENQPNILQNIEGNVLEQEITVIMGELKGSDPYLKLQNDIKSQFSDHVEQIRAVYEDQLAANMEVANARLRVIEEQERALAAFRNRAFIARIKNSLRARLGIYTHYEPRPLELPKHYYKKVKLENPPKISIVTPSFEQGNFIQRTIQSVLSQGYPNLEYIVQDGGSQDGTAEILSQYEHELSRWDSAEDNGQSHALNLGFKHTTGEIMAYLNSDDVILPGSLDFVADYFEKHPEVDVVYGHRILIDEIDREIGRWILPKHDDRVLAWADFIPQETLFWRRRIWDKIGGYVDENFKFAMDWDLILRFKEAGAKFVRLPRFLGAFRVHERQKSSAEISSTGKVEMELLRQRCHGRTVQPREINSQIRPYLLKHVVLHKLYRLGMVKY